MAFIEPYQFESSKSERARLLIAAVLWVDVIISWALLKDATNGGAALGAPALLCMAPSIAALVTLLRHKDLDGAKMAQVVAWGYVYAGTIFGTIFMIFSVRLPASESLLLLVLMVSVLAIQMVIPAAIRWARSEVKLWRAFVHYMRIFAIVVPILALLFVFNAA